MFHCLYYHAKKKTPPPINSDNQDLSDLKNKTLVENGVMKFRDIKHLHEVIDLYHDDLASLEKTYGYLSYNSKINQVMDDFDFISSESGFKTFMEENQNYITTRIRSGEKHYEEIIQPNINTYFANQDGLFYVGDSAYRIIGEFILSSEIKKVNQLLSIKYNNLVKSENKPNSARKYIKSQIIEISHSLKATTSYLGGDLIDYTTRSDGNRRVYLYADAGTQDFLGGKNYYVNINVWGEKKSWLGGWRKYKSNDIWLDGMDPSYDVIVQTPYWGIKYFTVGNIHVYNFKTYIHQLYLQPYYVTGTTDPIYFTKVDLRAMTGGSDPAFARIDETE